MNPNLVDSTLRCANRQPVKLNYTQRIVLKCLYNKLKKKHRTEVNPTSIPTSSKYPKKSYRSSFSTQSTTKKGTLSSRESCLC